MFKLQEVLKHRLYQLGLTDDDILNQITEYEQEARDYISLVLPNIKLTDGQLKVVIGAYVQYKLFSMVEMEGLVIDKKEYFDRIIDKIIENENNKIAQEKELKEVKTRNSKRIMVF